MVLFDNWPKDNGNKCASVVKIKLFKSKTNSAGSAKIKYKYFIVSDSTNESIRSSCLPVLTSLTAANPHFTLACVWRALNAFLATF